ncbi:tRNA (N6-isopentenyl adenosine(37)-C2)-methylthiotransferase MiaB [Candidatus Falkowbacteria bacterium CG10_big_fil_rev_8_21_14_0_10_39_9]|uniref:tRNA-2-methylthio-N(6)-dimethylallyladenosine synthase n=1 Tax=Candidatus Falkowbacteria bacterium CG10_big_fil_rev_8_21_14_0_10_39_9 TaxID=1974566 RepID=A0A2M6WP63_9BACT|nr:MAG: tRNA (N6-isopentenyl adenosine(37)-C2)-methylthiotransferase MiaB [Candidatus Falkowbacteria bacterium CG10_big_fil_rev_8_21_14_0_10_39_9]
MLTYQIITFGCQMNHSDSERLAAYLEKNNLVKVDDKFKADILIITTCGIRQSAEDRVYSLVHQIKKKHPQAIVVITGCLSERKDVRSRIKDKVDLWLPIIEMTSLLERIENPTITETNKYLDSKEYLSVLPKHESSFRAYVPIGNGCNNFCSYCVVPYARGREKYRSASQIVSEVKQLIKKGYKEVTLIAQNVNSYHSGPVDFTELLTKINAIPGDFWIRFVSSHPKDISSKLINALGKLPKVCEHVHFALQSGDDEILRQMNRRYTAQHFHDLVQKIRTAVKKYKPEWPVAITTDVIVGFPGETKKQFLETAKVFRSVKFDMAYISQYSPRYGTVSYQMTDDVTRLEKKRRENVLAKILSQTASFNNKYYLKKTVAVLVDGKNRQGEWYGKTRTYKLVRIMGAPANNLLGSFVLVKINKVRDLALEGKIIAQYE